jgi:copper(I)-binding protein
VIRHSRRMAAVGIAGALAVGPAVSACGVGNDPQTARPTQLTEGVNVTTKSGVAVRNLFILGPAPGAQLAANSAATVYAWIVNDSADGRPDRLIGIGAPGVAQGAQIQGGGVELPYQRLVQLGVPSPAGLTTPLITLQGLTTPLSGGESINLTLRFQNAGTLPASVPVVPRDGYYTTYAPAPLVTPSASATATATPSGSATPAATGGATASPSPTTSG